MSDEIREVHLKRACVHLRHKLMYADERQMTPGFVDDGSGTRVFFCAQSGDVLGPDDEAAGPDVCAGNRGCFKRA